MVAQVAMAARVIDCLELTTREINRTLRRLVADGATEIRLEHPEARHALAVALDGTVRICLDGPAGWYAAGMNCGPELVIAGNCGWGVAECMMSGRVEVRGHAGSGAAASIRGGLVSIEGDAGARAGIAMTGGTLVVRGSVGYMSGFMMQRGTMIVCGDAAEGLGDSLYEGVIYVAGRVAGYGADAVEKPLTDEDEALLRRTLEPLGIETGPETFRRVESGRRLWNFSTKEPELWRSAL